MKVTFISHVKNEGFALPTILIASVVMLIVLLSAIGASASIRSAIDSQYNNQLAREAAESGLAFATACLEKNVYVPQWTTASPLRPNTSCTGGAACTNVATCFVMTNSDVRTTFEVGLPVDQAVSQMVTVKAKVELLRSSDSGVWRTYTQETNARVGAELTFNNVAFGYAAYAADFGAYFMTIASDGKTRGVGWNTLGNLGNGTFSATLTPKEFILPGANRAAALYSNFVSGGFQLYAKTNNEDVYGAGRNDVGQLGDGTLTDRSTPVKFNLGSKKASYVSFNGFTTYVLTTDGNIYAAGRCDDGILGNGVPIIVACANATTPVRVALPTVNPADLNTIPTDNIVADFKTTYVLMQGGRVYAWGHNERGSLANGTTTSSPTPIKVGTYGDVGQPKATQVVGDGVSLWILDENGNVKTSGYNAPGGELGAKRILVQNAQSLKCLENRYNNALNIWATTCNQSSPIQQLTFNADKTIYMPDKDKCFDNQAQDGIHVQLWICNASLAQQYAMQDNGSILLINKNKCLSDTNADGFVIQFATCDGSARQRWLLPDQLSLLDVNMPASAGPVTKMSTDQWFTAFLTASGEVWSTGVNNCGQLGNGTKTKFQLYPTKFILPAGVTAVDVNVSSTSTLDALCKFNNIFVVGSNGRVYGAGSNEFGQLGDNTTVDKLTPVVMQVINGTTIKAKKVISGYGTTVIITTGNKVYTVGNNDAGQLGDGTTTNSLIPKANVYTNVLQVTAF